MRFVIIAFILLYFGPVAARIAVYAATEQQMHWSRADRSPTGLAPDPLAHRRAIVQIYAARTYRWRGVFAVHTWLAIKPAGADHYTRYDVTAWGEPLRVSYNSPDSRWVGNEPWVIYDVRGAQAQAMIPKIQSAIERYPYSNDHGYVVWPGPNSNSFIADVARAVPEMRVALPSVAVGKDFAPDWLSVMQTPSNTGWQISIAGYAGLAIGRVEGLEFHLLGQTLGIDILRPALKLPAFGRIGLSRS